MFDFNFLLDLLVTGEWIRESEKYQIAFVQCFIHTALTWQCNSLTPCLPRTLLLAYLCGQEQCVKGERRLHYCILFLFQHLNVICYFDGSTTSLQQKHHQSKLCFPKSKFFPNVCVSWCSSILKPSVGNNIRWFPVSFRLCAHLLSAVWLVCLNKSTIFLDVVGSDLLCHAATGQLSFPSVKLKQATL